MMHYTNRRILYFTLWTHTRHCTNPPHVVNFSWHLPGALSVAFHQHHCGVKQNMETNSLVISKQYHKWETEPKIDWPHSRHWSYRLGHNKNPNTQFTNRTRTVTHHKLESWLDTKCTDAELVTTIAHDAGKTRSEQAQFDWKCTTGRICVFYHQSNSPTTSLGITSTNSLWIQQNHAYNIPYSLSDNQR